MSYSIRALSQIPLIIKGFRKDRGLTQAAMAEKLGVTQQSYAYFEANPATATLSRLFMVLRLLDVEISLEQLSSDTSDIKNISNPNVVKTASQVTHKKNESSEVAAPKRVVSISQTKESW